MLHLDGHKGSKPVRLVTPYIILSTSRCTCLYMNHKNFLAGVSAGFNGYADANRGARRIGNGAIDHIQLVTSLCCLPPNHPDID